MPSAVAATAIVACDSELSSYIFLLETKIVTDSHLQQGRPRLAISDVIREFFMCYNTVRKRINSIQP